MTNDITIPPEVLEAGARAILKVWHVHPWELADTFHKDQSILEARAACLAMLNAWPGWEGSWTGDGDTLRRTIILPLPQENINAEG